MKIYLDYASLTPVDKKVLKETKRFSSVEYSNPSALYTSAVKAKNALDSAKSRVAKILNAHPDEIIFTSGGTESNSLVLENKNKHIVVSAIEHSSIIKNAHATLIPVDEKGFVDLEKLKASITSETTLVSIILVNNEVGTLEPINEVAKIVRDFKKKNNSEFPLLHTDACQAESYIKLDVQKMGVDLMSLDGNKIYGPRGVGMLYVKRGVEGIVRDGTVNIPGIMGFAKALEITEEIKEKEAARLFELKNYFFKELQKINKDIKINGDLENSTPHILNVSIPNIDSEFFVLQLDAKGIECSTKSACLRDEDESYVLRAMGKNSKNSVRFSFGRFTKKSDLNKVLSVIINLLKA